MLIRGVYIVLDYVFAFARDVMMVNVFSALCKCWVGRVLRAQFLKLVVQQLLRTVSQCISDI